MCNCESQYNTFPSVTIGGAPGDYLLPPPVPSNDFLEYQVVSVACYGVNPGTVIVSGVTKPFPIDSSGTSTYNGENTNNAIRGHIIPVSANTFIPVLGPWEQVSSPNAHIFIRIDGVVFAVVTLKQRVKILNVIPAPFKTNDPYSPQDTHLEREKRILTAVYGNEGETIEYGRQPAKSGTVRDLTTGSTPYGNAWGNWKGGKGRE